MAEYMELGRFKEIPISQAKHLIPWFVLEKEEAGQKKLRLISDCREINTFLTPRHFKMDTWTSIFLATNRYVSC